MFPAVRPICLPEPGEDYDNVTALVTGWGRNTSAGPQSNILEEAVVTCSRLVMLVALLGLSFLRTRN